MKFFKKIRFILVAIAVFGLIVFAAPVFAGHIQYHPLVQCGLQPGEGVPPEYTQDCTKCDFLKLLKNLIDFVLLFIVPVVGTLLILISGFMILLGGATPATISRGKTIFWNVFIGIVIIATSWLMVNFLLKSLAGGGDAADKWYQLECIETEVSTRIRVEGVIPDEEVELPSDPNVELNKTRATEILGLPQNIGLSTSADCGGSFNARQNIIDMATGLFPAVCSPECICEIGGSSGDITVNPEILRGLKQLSDNHNFTITSLTTGEHSLNSSHYTGEGVDIVPVSNDPQVWQDIRRALSDIGGTVICEDKNTGGNNSSCDLNNVNHIHWTLRK